MPKMSSMFVSLLVLLLGTAARAAPLETTWSDPVDGCIWEYTDETHTGLSLEQCKEKCLAASFGCNSMEWSEKSNKCWLSSETKETKPDGWREPCSEGYSDMIYLERLGLTEGDMILNAVQKEMFSNALIRNAEDQEKADNYKEGEEDSVEGEIETGKSMIGIEQFKWPEKTLYYDLSEISFWSTHWHGMKKKIRKALKNLESKLGDNCVKFVEKKSGPRVEVHTHSDDGCLSEVGYQSAHETKAQLLNVSPGGCGEGKIQHEFLHALGFFHMQSRSDRDKYITVKEENILPSARNNFAKHQPWMIKHFGLPFDYKSIMMYGGKYFSRNGRRTIETIDPEKQKFLGNRAYLTDGDIQMIRKAYGCG